MLTTHRSKRKVLIDEIQSAGNGYRTSRPDGALQDK